VFSARDARVVCDAEEAARVLDCAARTHAWSAAAERLPRRACMRSFGGRGGRRFLLRCSRNRG